MHSNRNGQPPSAVNLSPRPCVFRRRSKNFEKIWEKQKKNILNTNTRTYIFTLPRHTLALTCWLILSPLPSLSSSFSGRRPSASHVIFLSLSLSFSFSFSLNQRQLIITLFHSPISTLLPPPPPKASCEFVFGRKKSEIFSLQSSCCDAFSYACQVVLKTNCFFRLLPQNTKVK